MKYDIITAVGIDVSKGKSTVAVRRPGGEVVLTPFQVNHDAAGLSSLVKTLQDVGGNIRIVMEHTGMYWRPIALALKEAGFLSAWSTPCSSTISATTLCARSKRTRRTP
ncbi:MAG: IS110 family transposase [Oscillospiraceae bacterium]|nr:IS110 family transposase [Oscillospiraceae bacterium]